MKEGMASWLESRESPIFHFFTFFYGDDFFYYYCNFLTGIVGLFALSRFIYFLGTEASSSPFPSILDAFYRHLSSSRVFSAFILKTIFSLFFFIHLKRSFFFFFFLFLSWLNNNDEIFFQLIQ